ncbi:hypothetical protein A3H80_03870 [Candidatus Roizmanbacteria bacterium RIFCSPLOWO2_02_FULL_37_19]|uniref:Uncharacterized protein n=1 Tax=Candidatus Roizmanbacteria bacterium RIFCSPHIGHO2_02_FULL_37_24 TaxID=1802037 RepID=A0A1F7GXS3_9BACT|nr:MAG: hypothetical protein A2862_03830 [Candidatus Roizmanbacteria bacterium RIFCSPHIGHO2_01_FULL_38_41]OGK23302.1 MAG: hypothetical protein A3C24_03860 [Candidatus Roizmanbacteria bacterium RIFCSPHIGHO2_02_FULL_37_24]OGK32315.1 MAG: hypothetical protein A3E10_04100 [Candidatus Roizmanbacteria bacterium RIFCSPHIGHO2_12_FULL_37_23]OGK44565.1 MAG: hypothetical protein A2956_02640 [Candidatus Roizmanbacteria bacterium RIFCSPLOWO2_01_FULL_37_57]OGK54833.1 MAG: hypothetical protein A3H80_03870 [Ca
MSKQNNNLSHITKSLDEILKTRPILSKILESHEITDYLKPAFEWNPNERDFPYKNLLCDIICSEVHRLYGKDISDGVRKQFRQAWSVETGAHLHIPKKFDRVTKQNGPQITPLLFQGQVLWASVGYSYGFTYNMSLNSGRIPPNNINSGAYIEFNSIPSLRTVASKYKETPQSYIPSIKGIELQEKKRLVESYFLQKSITEDEYIRAQAILYIFENETGGFSDQVAVSHAHMLNTATQSTITQVTLDSELIGLQLFSHLLDTHDSVIYKIFSDSELRKKFMKTFQDISTGWNSDESPFNELYEHNTSKVLCMRNYSGDLEIGNLKQLILRKKLLPRGVMKFFMFIVECGICPIGGWNQSAYCTDIRDRSVEFLKEIGLTERAQHVEMIPTNIAGIAPAWGFKTSNDGIVHLLDAISVYDKPLTKKEFENIAHISSRDALLIALPSLYSFLLDPKLAPSLDQIYLFVKDENSVKY